MKSVPSSSQARVRFVNRSNREAEIVWIDFEGHLLCYRKLLPEHFLDINTFIHHPWIAIDLKTKDNLHLNRKEVFVVEGFSREVMIGNEMKRVTQADIRIPVYITLPLDSLKICAAKVVRDLIGNVKNIEHLELPAVLINDLKQLFEYKSKNMNISRRDNQ